MSPDVLINNLLNNSKAMQNPMFANVVNLYRQGDTKGLQEMAENLCRTKGTTLEEFRKQIGI